MSTRMPAQPPTPRTRDAGATREALLAAAQTAFAHAGFSGARVDDIAKSSGYNKSLIFQYFVDKSGLYHAVVRRLREKSDEQSGAALKQIVGDETELDRSQIEKLLRASVAWSYQHLSSEPEYLRLFAWEMAEGWRAFKSSDMVERSNLWGLTILTTAQQNRVIRSDVDPRSVVVLLTVLPFVSLASLPRYEGFYPALSATETTSFLQDQTIKQILHIVFPESPAPNNGESKLTR
jgi:TetR/AcrR family transcriptional regulator